MRLKRICCLFVIHNVDQIQILIAYPFFIIGRILQKKENITTEGIFILSMSEIQVWFPRLIRSLIRRRVKVSITIKSLYFPHNHKVEPDLPKRNWRNASYQ